MLESYGESSVGIVVMFPELSNQRVMDINGEVIDKDSKSLEGDSNMIHAGNLTRMLSDNKDSPDEKDNDETPSEKNKRKMYRKREYVLNELLETEKAYLQDLSQIVDGYIELVKKGEIEKPASLLGREMVVFGNIHQIHDWHSKTFLPEMERNLKAPRKLANTFIKHERKFDMYVIYCENKPKSEDLVYENLAYFEELREILDQKFQLADMLIKPVQRIMKYKLLFKDILKYTERAGDDVKEIQKALEVMCVIPKAANNMMNVSRLQGFDGKVTFQGRLLLQNDLLILEEPATKKFSKTDKSQFQNRRTFLFEQIIIFSEQPDKKKNPHTRPIYLYRNCIRVNKMSLKSEVPDDEMAFILLNKAPNAQTRFVCRASDANSKKNWVTQISLQMEMQNDFLKALQSPIQYQNEGKDISQANSLEASVETEVKPEKTTCKPNKSKTRSFRNLFIRQNSSHGASNAQLSLSNEQNTNANSEPKTSGVHVEVPKSKWSLLRKKTVKNVISTLGTDSHKCQENINLPSPENKIDSEDLPKISIHSSMNNLLSLDGCQNNEKDIKERKRFLLDSSESLKCEENISNASVETEDDIHKTPKTAGVVWNNLRMLFKRQSVTAMPVKISSKENLNSLEKITFESQTSKESIKEDDEEKKTHITARLENTTAMEKSHVTLVCKVTSTQALRNQNDMNTVSKKHVPNTLEIIYKKNNEIKQKKENKNHITWLNPQDEIISNSLEENIECRQIEKNQFECKLTLYNLKINQSGVYKCQITNSQCLESSEAILKIVPEIKSKPRLKVNTPLNEELNSRLSSLTSSLSATTLPFFHSHSPKNKKRFDQDRWSQDLEDKFIEVSFIHQSKRLTVIKKLVKRNNYTEMVVGKFCSRFFRSKESIWKETILNNSIDHPSLVKVLEIFEINSGYVSIYPYIEHGRLFDYIQTTITQSANSNVLSTFTDTQALQLSTQLFSALYCLHKRNIVHLKINPENLLIDMSEPNEPSIKVIDFSDARQLDSSSNNLGYVHCFNGDVEFTAPEILKHFSVTCYVDIWNAGVVLYTMLTGETPFYRKDLQGTCHAVVENSYEVENIPNESIRKLFQFIFVMPPSKRLSACMCFEKCRILSATVSPTPLAIPPTLLREFLDRRVTL